MLLYLSASSSFLFVYTHDLTQLLQHLVVALSVRLGQWKVNGCDSGHPRAFCVRVPLPADCEGRLHSGSDGSHQLESLNDCGAEPIPSIHALIASSLTVT